MTMYQRKWNPIPLEEGWAIIQKGIDKLINILEERSESQFSSEEYMMLNTTVYNMCTQRPPNDWSQHLYDKYREVFEQYITSTVLPCLRKMHGEFMLRELVKRWQNHKFMVHWLSRCFHYLERYFIPTRGLTSLNEVGLTCFRNLVYQEMNGKVGDTVTALFVLEREGKQIDRALLKNVSDVFVEMGMGQMDHYENWILERSLMNLEIATVKDSGANGPEHNQISFQPNFMHLG